MTPETQLKAIIEAQVKGGYKNWNLWGSEHLMFGSVGDLSGYTSTCDLNVIYTEKHHILEILLDPVGLKAVWGQGHVCTANGHPWMVTSRGHCDACGCGSFYPHDEFAGHCILDTWLSSDGDATKTIQTAYDLLPS